MMRPLSWAGAWLIATALVAQQTPPDPKPAAPATAAERLAALVAEQKQMMDDYMAAARAASAKAKDAPVPGKAVPAMPMRPDLSPLVAKAKAAAADYAGTDVAVPFLMFIIKSGGKKEEMVEALDVLTDKHLESTAVAELGMMISFLPRMVPEDKAKLFTGRLAKSTNADVRGWVAFAQHQSTIENADRDGETYKLAKLELQKAAELATDKRLRSEITGAIEVREKFGVGNVAPDIEGPDLDGVAFKLSDYKGKVVFLDFWGDW